MHPHPTHIAGDKTIVFSAKHFPFLKIFYLERGGKWKCLLCLFSFSDLNQCQYKKNSLKLMVTVILSFQSECSC